MTTEITYKVQKEIEFDELMRESAAIVSGWDGGFHTKSNNVSDPKKVIPISSQELLSNLQELKKLCNSTTINRLFSVIANHAKDTNNPHGFDLSEFTSGILNILYNEYKTRGGVAQYEGFLQILFADYRIAGLDDLIVGDNEKLLISVALAASYISKHDASVYAHEALLKKIYPGVPVDEDPSLGYMSDFNFPMSIQFGGGDKFTYIGKDKYLYTATSSYLPIDYTYSVPSIACFEKRTNEIKFCNNFLEEDWNHEYLDIVTVEKTNIDKTTTTTKIKETVDTASVKRNLSLINRNVTGEECYSYSLFYSPIYGKYAELEVFDQSLNSTMHKVILNFEEGSYYVTSSSSKCYIELIKLAENFYHIRFSFYIDYTTKINVKLSPYISSVKTSTYKGTGLDLAYITYGQFEKGNSVSPFIYTNGIETSREAIYVNIPVTGIVNQEYGLFKVDIISPTILKHTEDRTVFTLRNTDNIALLSTYDKDNVYSTKVYNALNFEYVNYFMSPTKCMLTTLVFAYNAYNFKIGATGITSSSKPNPSVMRTDYDTLCLGHNNNTNYLNGYIRSIFYYNYDLSLDKITFLTGE